MSLMILSKFSYLPEDIVNIIFMNLSQTDLCCCAGACSVLRSILRQDPIHFKGILRDTQEHWARKFHHSLYLDKFARVMSACGWTVRPPEPDSLESLCPSRHLYYLPRVMDWFYETRDRSTEPYIKPVPVQTIKKKYNAEVYHQDQVQKDLDLEWSQAGYWRLPCGQYSNGGQCICDICWDS